MRITSEQGSVYTSAMLSDEVDGLTISYLACGLWHMYHRVLI